MQQALLANALGEITSAASGARVGNTSASPSLGLQQALLDNALEGASCSAEQVEIFPYRPDGNHSGPKQANDHESAEDDEPSVSDDSELEDDDPWEESGPDPSASSSSSTSSTIFPPQHNHPRSQRSYTVGAPDSKRKAANKPRRLKKIEKLMNEDDMLHNCINAKSLCVCGTRCNEQLTLALVKSAREFNAKQGQQSILDWLIGKIQAFRQVLARPPVGKDQIKLDGLGGLKGTVCYRVWCKVYGISVYQQNTATRALSARARTGDNTPIITVHGSASVPRTLYIKLRWLEYVFLPEMFDEYCDGQLGTADGDRHIPLFLDATAISKLAKAAWKEQGWQGKGPTPAQITEVMKSAFPNYSYPDPNGLFHCDCCQKLHKQKLAVNSKESREAYEAARTKHCIEHMEPRLAFMKRCARATSHPDQLHAITADNTNAIKLPSMKADLVSNNALVGVDRVEINVGCGIISHRKLTVIYFGLDTNKKGSNAALTILYHMLRPDVTSADPSGRSPTLDITLDGASDNINKAFWAFCADILGKEWMVPGHTHQIADQRFSTLRRALKKHNVYDLYSFVKLVKNAYAKNETTVLFVRQTYDWVNYYAPFLKPLNGMRSPLSVHFFVPDNAPKGSPGRCRYQDNPAWDKNIGWFGENGLVDGSPIEVLTTCPPGAPAILPLLPIGSEGKKGTSTMLQILAKDASIPSLWLQRVLANREDDGVTFDPKCIYSDGVLGLAGNVSPVSGSGPRQDIRVINGQPADFWKISAEPKAGLATLPLAPGPTGDDTGLGDPGYVLSAKSPLAHALVTNITAAKRRRLKQVHESQGLADLTRKGDQKTKAVRKKKGNTGKTKPSDVYVFTFCGPQYKALIHACQDLGEAEHDSHAETKKARVKRKRKTQSEEENEQSASHSESEQHDREESEFEAEEKETKTQAQRKPIHQRVTFAQGLTKSWPGYKGPWKLLPAPKDLTDVLGQNVLHLSDEGDWCLGKIHNLPQNSDHSLHNYEISFRTYRRDVQLDLDEYIPSKISSEDCDNLPAASWVLLGRTK